MDKIADTCLEPKNVKQPSRESLSHAAKLMGTYIRTHPTSNLTEQEIIMTEVVNWLEHKRDMSKMDKIADTCLVDETEWKRLLKVDTNARALVAAIEEQPDASQELLGLKAVLKPAEPEYVPLVSGSEPWDSPVSGTWKGDTCRRTAQVLRRAADRLVDGSHIDSLVTDDDMQIADKLREWADQEEKYNA